MKNNLIPEVKIDLNFDRCFGGDFLVATFIIFMSFINDVAFVQKYKADKFPYSL